MTRRRVSCPQVTQQLWDAIKSIRNTRQVPTAERIQKIMQKDFGVKEDEVTRQLNHCVRDGLIEVTKRTVSKGNHAGSEQEWYKLPMLKVKSDSAFYYDLQSVYYALNCYSIAHGPTCGKNHVNYSPNTKTSHIQPIWSYFQLCKCSNCWAGMPAPL